MTNFKFEVSFRFVLLFIIQIWFLTVQIANNCVFNWYFIFIPSYFYIIIEIFKWFFDNIIEDNTPKTGENDYN